MGLQFKDLVVKKEITIGDLKDKVLAVDTYNLLYQFLTTIRGPDGSAFTNSKGQVTSHLIGLFSRTTSLMEEGLKLVFVVDGTAPALKQKTWEKRAEVKQEAAALLKKAEESGQIEEMKKFASRTAVLTKEMLADAKKVIAALGLPIVQAPSEGEAQATHLVKKKDAYAVVSQDYDNLMFGCPLLVRNLSIVGKRKRVGKLAWQTVKPEMISLAEVLQHLQFNQDQLIALGMLIGTDYNPGGIKGLGPQKGLKAVQGAKSLEELFVAVQWGEHYPDLPWQEVFDTIKNIPVTNDYILKWESIKEKELIALLVQDYEFSEERVMSKLEKLKGQQHQGQKGLGSFFS